MGRAFGVSTAIGAAVSSEIARPVADRQRTKTRGRRAHFGRQNRRHRHRRTTLHTDSTRPVAARMVRKTVSVVSAVERRMDGRHTHKLAVARRPRHQTTRQARSAGSDSKRQGLVCAAVVSNALSRVRSEGICRIVTRHGVAIECRFF